MLEKILVDTDIIVYRIACSVESNIYVVKNGIYNRHGYAKRIAEQKNAEIFKRRNIGSEKELRRNLKKTLDQMQFDLGGDTFHHFITSSKVLGNFRNDVATYLPYKGNRIGSEKPWFYNKIRKILHEEYGATLVHGQEADDQLAITQLDHFNQEKTYEHTVIATIDKDARTIPGNHYHMDRRTVDFVSEDWALKNFYRQLLVGDTTDNIPGLTKLLKLKDREEESKKLSYTHYNKKYVVDTREMAPDQAYKYVADMYTRYGFGHREMGEIGTLLWLRHYPGQIWADDFYGKGWKNA